MRKLTIVGMMCSLFAFVVMASGSAEAAPEISLRFAGQFPPEHTATGYMNEIAGAISERSGGRIEVKVYPANQLGDYTLVHQELIKGTIDMALISTPGDIDPRMNFVYINGYCAGYNQLGDIFKPGNWAFRKMDELNQALGVKFLGFNVEGFIGIASTKPVTEPLNPKVDKGVLCRVPNMAPYKLGAEAMGYRTVTIPYSDLYTALQTGVADAVDGLPPAAAYTILKDVTKYWYQLNYSIENESYMMSMQTWNKLSADDQKIVADAVAEAAAKSITIAKKDDESYMQLMRDQGIETHTYTEEELLPIQQAVAATWESLADIMTKPFMDEFVGALAPK
ncbi:MAG: TRAP transporter substrate-binding protein DctP [Synergistaceae bacterium]|jgi:TRAP-type C4-dicarboxylate transport system substrate-binding protein|nr:TRAP transporter substrate-binding protein DctP [Synergistaceae bacterium]